MEGEFMRLRAMAKINLGLDVLRKREDGYHEVRMIMQTIQMYDLLDIRKKEEPYLPIFHMSRQMKEIWYIKQQNFLWMNLISKKAFL